MNFQMFKLVLEKAEEPGIKLPTSANSSKKQESSRKTSISALLTMPKPMTVWITISSVQSVSCPTLCDPMNHSMPDLPVHHQHPGFTQTHVHRVSDAIKPSHSLSSPSPPAPNPPRIRAFSSESTLRMRWPEYWSFSFSILSKEGFGIVNKAEIDVFLELSCFYDDPADVGNLVFCSSAFSIFILNIWNFTVHVLLKSVLETFEHYFASA